MMIPFPTDDPFSTPFETLEMGECEEDTAFLTYIDAPIEQQPVLESLLDIGFTWDEALALIRFREGLYEVPEMVERLQNDPHLGFTKWLCTHGYFSEGIPDDHPDAGYAA